MRVPPLCRVSRIGAVAGSEAGAFAGRDRKELRELTLEFEGMGPPKVSLFCAKFKVAAATAVRFSWRSAFSVTCGSLLALCQLSFNGLYRMFAKKKESEGKKPTL